MKKMILFSKCVIFSLGLALGPGFVQVQAQKLTRTYETDGLKMTVKLDYTERDVAGKKQRDNCQIIVEVKNTTTNYLFSKWSTSIAFKGKEHDSAARSEQSGEKESLWLYPGESKSRSLTGCFLEGYSASVNKKEKVDPKTWKKVN